MKKKLAALLLGAAVAGSFVMQSFAEGTETTFCLWNNWIQVKKWGDAGLNPHDNYSGWSCLRYGVGETLFKYNDNMEPEPWLATSYEFVDETTVKSHCGRMYTFPAGV